MCIRGSVKRCHFCGWNPSIQPKSERYVCAYFVFHELNGDEKWDVKLDDIEKMVKLFKSHRCDVDFDKKFVQDELVKADTSEFVQKMSKMISKKRA